MFGKVKQSPQNEKTEFNLLALWSLKSVCS